MKEIIYSAHVATKAQRAFIMASDFDNLPDKIDDAYNTLVPTIPFGTIAIKLKSEIQLINDKHEALLKIIYPSWSLSVTTPKPTSISASIKS
jgi:hypothetical protein